MMSLLNLILFCVYFLNVFFVMTRNFFSRFKFFIAKCCFVSFMMVGFSFYLIMFMLL